MKWRRPGRVVVAGFALATLVGTVPLMLPIASESGERTEFGTALFTSVSAICVTSGRRVHLRDRRDRRPARRRADRGRQDRGGGESRRSRLTRPSNALGDDLG